MANEVTIHVKAKDDASRTMKQVEGNAKKWGDGLKKVAVGAGVAAAAVGTLLVKGAVHAISAASDMNETLNKSTTIFGKMQPVVSKFASTAAKDLGLSRQAAMESAASFGDMFLQLGFAGKQATRMSLNVVRLAADLGSFNNLPTADVQERIAAAFRGEYDSLQALVPTISAATVQQRAMADTGKKNAEKLTQQEKAAATLAIIMDSTSRAQGDFAKTSDGLANSLKIARARLDDMAASAGKALLPFAQEGMKGFNRFLDRLEGSKGLKKSLHGLTTELGYFVSGGDSATETADNLADSFIDVANSAHTAFKKFNTANDRFIEIQAEQRQSTLKWRIKMLEAQYTVLNALGKFNPAMKKMAQAVKRELETVKSEFTKTSNEMNRKKTEPKVRADIHDLQAKIRTAQHKLRQTHDQKTRARITANINQLRGQVGLAKMLLASIHDRAVNITTRRRTVYVGGGHSVGYAAGGPVGAGRKAAEGGPRGGQVLVGENGPEVVDLPMGSHVNPSANSKKMGWGNGPMVFVFDLGKGIQQRIEVHDREIMRAVGAGRSGY